MLDPRLNLYGFQIGQRSDSEWTLATAMHHVSEARFYRHNAAVIGRWNPRQAAADRAYARWHLAQAARWRRSFLNRRTPHPDQTAAWSAYPTGGIA